MGLALCALLSLNSLISLNSLNKTPDGHCSSGVLIERQQTLPYKKKLNLLREWCSSGADTRKGGWDILSVFPIRLFD